jgi:lipopolysaccharide transport system ATP-binding protein
MSDIAIRVEGLSKQYRIGGKQERYKTLRDTLADAISAPFHRASRILRGHATGAAELDETIWALQNVSFDIKRGEVVGFIGRNGAGKSTLLKILSRITEPTEGFAEIHGRVGSLIEVGTGFHQELTGRENIYLNGAILGMKRAEIERKFDEIVAFAEVEKFIDTPVKHFSSGMYLRLAFAVAAHLEPEILLVDEVLAVGDAAFQKKCLGKMQDVSREGRTVLFVSHNMSAIAKLCSRAMLIDQGHLITAGLSADVVSHYFFALLGASATAAWTDFTSGPGANGFKLLSVNVTDAAEAPISMVNIEKPIKLKIGYYLSVPNLKFRCAAGFYTRGACAFYTLELTETVRERVGQYYSTVYIPGNLLAEGEYTVGISVFASRGKKLHYCRANDVVAFQVYDPVTGNSARGDYAEGLEGVIRPQLEWQNEYAGPELLPR